MTSPAADRRRFASISKALADIETDVPADPAALAAAVKDADDYRRAHGLVPLHQSELPEEEFYRRARALGLRRLGR